MSKPVNKKKQPAKLPVSPDYLVSMRYAQPEGKASSLFAMLPVIVFSAIVILIVRCKTYSRPFDQFSWTPQSSSSEISDFFSYNKMMLVLICAVLVLIILLYKLCTESLSVQRSKYYIPMLVYSAFVLISFICSDIKEFALLGWTDRFEGTLPLLAYMIMLFYVMNTVTDEKNVKQIFWPLAVSSFLLNVIGLLQGMGRDFFMTALGQKLICRNFTLQGGSRLYDLIDQYAAEGKQYFEFSFNGIAYQTVYNPNYVSFYLTLLIPLFTMLLLRSMLKESGEKWYKSVGLVALIGLQIYNVMASRSAGGYLGLAVSFVVALIVLNKKLVKWWKPLLAFVLVAVIALGVTFNVWSTEFKSALNGIGSKTTQVERTVTASMDELTASAAPASVRAYIDYMHTDADGIYFSVFGTPAAVVLTRDDNGDVRGLKVVDENGAEVPLTGIDGQTGTFSISDPRYYECTAVNLAHDDSGNNFITLKFKDADFRFVVGSDDIYYINPYGIACVLDSAEGIGFRENLQFGTMRGYIWSRTLPMLKDTVFVGHGADTFCAYFPHMDYSGKYNATYTLETIVDKAHNMFLGTAVGTGVISAVALLVLFVMYIVQSLGIYVKADFGSDFMMFAGSGIFIGICGFLTAAMVNDSSISVMPMFYTLLGTGIAVNTLIKRRNAGKAIEAK